MNTFSNIIFDRRKHIYTLDGQRLPSVTSYVNKLKTPFDADYWSKRKAKERGISPQTILAEWDEKRRRSQEKGTQIHEYIEGVLLDQGHEQTDDPFLAYNRLPEMDVFDQLWRRVGGDLDIHQVEWVIGDAQLKVAGTVDAVFYSYQTELYHVWDWKTNSKFRTNNRFQTLLSPFGDLDECEFTNYSFVIHIPANH